jgi:hypothetical protein
VCAHDQRILDDYAQFRKVRAAVHICPGQWAKMTKRTKAALLRMVALAVDAARAGKLGTPNTALSETSG